MRRIRKQKELTQEQVAETADLHPNYISFAELRRAQHLDPQQHENRKGARVTMGEFVAEETR
jgi:hypothetical protein